LQDNDCRKISVGGLERRARRDRRRAIQLGDRGGWNRAYLAGAILGGKDWGYKVATCPSEFGTKSTLAEIVGERKNERRVSRPLEVLGRKPNSLRGKSTQPSGSPIECCRKLNKSGEAQEAHTGRTQSYRQLEAGGVSVDTRGWKMSYTLAIKNKQCLLKIARGI